MYSLRRVEEFESTIAMELINQAKAFLKAQGIDQWQTGYPDLECIQKDVRCGKGYFMVGEDGKTLAYMCIDFDGEPAYESLDGAWLTDVNARYGVVHRLAIDQSFRGRGLASKAFELVEKMCAGIGAPSIRIDTDADNRIMRHLLDKCGFVYCGMIRFDNSDKIAFEKILA